MTEDVSSSLLRWIPLLPLLGAVAHGVLLVLLRRPMPRGLTILVSCGSVVLAFLISCIASAFFFGGWNFPGMHLVSGLGVFYQLLCAAVFIAKGMFGVFLMMWLRWTLPRIRIDQVMTMGYKYLTPIGFVLVIAQAIWVAWVG